MIDPTSALALAAENSAKVADTPLFTTVIDKLTGFKLSEWKAQGDIIRQQISEGYEEAKQKGLGIQYITAFRSSTNLINIGAKAAKFINSTEKKEVEMENDVFWGLIDHSKGISNEDMQELIAKIIAGEYNTPGTYSMSTLQTIKMLGKDELNLFEKICSLSTNDGEIPQILFSFPEDAKEIMKEVGVDFESLQLLQSVGLFLPNSMSTSHSNPGRKKYSLKYFDKSILYCSENEKHPEIQTPSFYCMSLAGKQIVKHLNPKFNSKYFEWLKANYKISEYRIEEK